MYNTGLLYVRVVKPIHSQLTSLPVVGLLYLLMPKPITELLHNTGSYPLAFSSFPKAQNYLYAFFYLKPINKILCACSRWFCFYFNQSFF
jgi:hypothetical protein